MRALVGLWPLSGGDLRIDGTPIASYDQWSRVGFVPQRASAESGVPASVWEVVASGRLTHRRPFRPMSARADRDAVRRAIEVVGLQGKARDGISSLSGGQQQRALIARALAGEPDLFFLDEPTAGVDLPNQQALADALAQLSERGATIVLVAHELGPLAPLVERSVVMRDGRIAYDGAPLGDHEVHAPQFGEAPGTTTTTRAPCSATTCRTSGHPSTGGTDRGPLHPRLHAARAGRGAFTGLAAPAVAPTSSSGGWP